ncbi:MAG TPA: F0F1 ATP synthase subunit B [Acidimicrobiia bacterium]|nr:F0F1 ATP synthase subunit B [Acidimicrobiia bacterium]
MFNLLGRLLLQAGEVVEEPHTAEPSGLDLVLPEINELIAGVIAFAIVFAVVWVWARPAIARTLAARQDAITGQLKAAESTKLEAESLLDDYRKQVAGARDEANRIVEEARRTAEALRAETATRAGTEAAEIVRKAREEAAGERDRAAAAIRAEVASLSLAVAEKAVVGAVDAKAQQKLVEQYIAELGGLRP